jgi:RNA-binding protein FUS
MNWARRNKCNMCGAFKPGTTDTRREGQVGVREAVMTERAMAAMHRQQQDTLS